MTSITPQIPIQLERTMSVSTSGTRPIATGTWRTYRPEYVTRSSPCNLDCPAGNDVRGFLAAATAGDVETAWRILRRTNPLPAVCGRVCYHPCEIACNRSGLDEAIAVHAVERAIADQADRLHLAPDAPHDEPLSRRIGIVGAGPAGLTCAYHLARRGYAITVFDEHPEPGGMLRYGIPAYRLPREVLDREIGLLEALGITFVRNARIGSGGAAPELSSFAALFLGIGAQRPRHSRVMGDAVSGIEPGISLLHEVNSGGHRRLEGAVLIVGGGNTAIDTARVALRLGATPTVAYRRSREDMPAHPDEIAQAEAEGVAFIFHATPIRYVDEGGRVAAVELQRLRPGEADASGRRAPEIIPGATFSVRASHVFTAIGEEVDVEVLHAFAVAANGRLKADAWGRTRKPTVFAGGDAATGAGTVVDAIGSGRRAAGAIEAYLSGHDLVEAGVAERVAADGVNLFYFPRAARAQAQPRPMNGERFDELVPTLSWADAMKEAGRCFTCGSCTACDNCYVFCPDAAIVPDRETRTYAIDLAHCKGCGICAAECPRGAVALVPEAQR